MKSFLDLFLPHDEQKRMSLRQKAFREIAAKLQEADWLDNWPTVSEVRTAALLASEGYLTSQKRMKIGYMDITDIPRDQMEKLTSIVTEKVYINNITPTSRLGSILAGVQCSELWLSSMDLSEENTRALVTAMRDRVDRVTIGYITLDMEELMKYDGRGRCRELWVKGDDTPRIEDRWRRWPSDAGWIVKMPNNVWFGSIMFGSKMYCDVNKVK